MKALLLQALEDCSSADMTASFLAMLLSVSAIARAKLDAQLGEERTPGAPLSSSPKREVQR